MKNWKKSVACGAIGAGVVLALTGRRNVGVASIAGGLAMMASEYPERFEAVLANAPEYIGRATRFFGALTRLSEKYAEGAERRSVEDSGEFV